MGCAAGKGAQVDESTVKQSKAIDNELKNRKQVMNREIKLLLLGAGESGKSTIFKQIKLIKSNGFTKDECMMLKDAVYANTLSSMKILVDQCANLGIAIQSPDNLPRAQRLAEIDNAKYIIQINSYFTPEVCDDIEALWQDDGIRQCYKRRAEFQINDSAEYYFENIQRIRQSDYCPSEQDVLRSRVKTTGIVETDFHMDNFHFRVFDVGGQRNERKKWIHCFQGVTAVIFVSAISEYDQKCYEDDTTNRIRESLLLFEDICNSKWFTDTSMILFFNKTDLFQEKIKTVDLSACFDDYTGGCNYENATKFIEAKFRSLNKNPAKAIYTHFTCATDTTNIKRVFDATQAIILQNNLRNNGLL